MKMKRGLIIGKGWIGSRLEDFLQHKYTFTTTKRESDAVNCISVNFDAELIPFINTKKYDFVIITIPFGKRNSLKELELRFTNISNFLSNYKGQIILLSSTGIYPNNDQIVSEDTYHETDLAEPYICIENLIKMHFPQLNILRLGGIMGDDRYLSKYIDLNKDELNDMVNHIHYKDIIKVINTCIEKEIKSSIYNVVAPQHPTKREILEYQINNKVIDATIKKGKIISSEKLISELNYQFLFPNPLEFKG